MKKLFAVLVALTLVLSMGTIALAADTWTGAITLNSAAKISKMGAKRFIKTSVWLLLIL